MSWSEFRSLLCGLSEKSSLARTVSVRLENDPKVIESFTPAQRRIRDKWLSKRRTASCSKQELNSFLDQMKAAFAAM